MTALDQTNQVADLGVVSGADRPRVALLMGPSTYRAGAFLGAAERLDLELLTVVDLPKALAEHWQVELAVDFADPDRAAAQLVETARTQPLSAILSVDDSASLIAAKASAALGLHHNDPKAALAARDKLVMRQQLAARGVRVPRFSPHSLSADPEEIAGEIAFPVVIKPLRLSGSRGVIRANDAAEFVRAFARTRAMLLADGADAEETQILVEQYLPGIEVALEGLMTGGELTVLALFDKPDPLEGPFFEETIYLTPSRLLEGTQQAIAKCTAEAARALGLCHGPVHAELRINERGVWPVELAGRSIGGLCSSILEFGTGVKLEDLILLHAVGRELPSTERDRQAAGVMMIPIPCGGILRDYQGVEEARSVPGVTGVEITAKRNHPLVPLPEGASYLGFIFARGERPESVEMALREAHRKLSFTITPTISLGMVR